MWWHNFIQYLAYQYPISSTNSFMVPTFWGLCLNGNNLPFMHYKWITLACYSKTTCFPNRTISSTVTGSLRFTIKVHFNSIQLPNSLLIICACCQILLLILPQLFWTIQAMLFITHQDSERFASTQNRKFCHACEHLHSDHTISAG